MARSDSLRRLRASFRRNGSSRAAGDDFIVTGVRPVAPSIRALNHKSALGVALHELSRLFF